MRLDHFVIHVDNDPGKLYTVSEKSKEAGFPFEPTKGKGNRGFKVANIWVGDQYFEIPWLKNADGGGWRSEWVEKYNQGSRGIYCVFLKTQNLAEIESGLISRGIACKREKVEFKALFGLLKKTMPWTCLHLPPIPGTDIEISFIEYEPGVMEKYLAYMTPNAQKQGIDQIQSATIQIPDLETALPFLKNVFPRMKFNEVDLDGQKLVFKESESAGVSLAATSRNKSCDGKFFELENVRVEVGNPLVT